MRSKYTQKFNIWFQHKNLNIISTFKQKKSIWQLTYIRNFITEILNLTLQNNFSLWNEWMFLYLCRSMYFRRSRIVSWNFIFSIYVWLPVSDFTRSVVMFLGVIGRLSSLPSSLKIENMYTCSQWLWCFFKFIYSVCGEWTYQINTIC